MSPFERVAGLREGKGREGRGIGGQGANWEGTPAGPCCGACCFGRGMGMGCRS